MPRTSSHAYVVDMYEDRFHQALHHLFDAAISTPAWNLRCELHLGTSILQFPGRPDQFFSLIPVAAGSGHFSLRLPQYGARKVSAKCLILAQSARATPAATSSHRRRHLLSVRAPDAPVAPTTYLRSEKAQAHLKWLSHLPIPLATSGVSKSGTRTESKPRGSLLRGNGSSSHPGSEDTRALEPIADEGDGTSVRSSTRLSPSAAPTPTTWSITNLARRQNCQSLKQRGGKPVATDSEPARIENSTSPSASTITLFRFNSLSARSASIDVSLPRPYGSTLPNMAHLADDLQFYLNIIELALQHGSLLYAVVGFSAYHHCVQNNSGKLYSFLKYYNIALKLLRKSLSSGELHNEATLITVLVLATFEESIGNWVNLMCTIRLHKH
ncbi:uncharacterized protein BO88DRAFT_458466 [Aspergillus vadensis CBS 113365]|uniref:Uncharacterized protein n=1 Tax=Aspergillus vadensis (strain CBS 113365 / IMI 142717 / IBT 24658) TaxID=1448311 RepID=A0A319B171_ASPVC|nr:hypothetical protein BO88DRAFT_458466 [Aspergillus vadensis CBS 113365]PYH63950.1 hypothetical protein BO88DRAFT_458466 [Aspergillus vadensis CBS 113365]